MTDGLPPALAPARDSRVPVKWRAVVGFQAADGVALGELTSALVGWHRTVALEWRARGFSNRTGVRIPGTEQALHDSIGAMVGGRSQRSTRSPPSTSRTTSRPATSSSPSSSL